MKDLKNNEEKEGKEPKDKTNKIAPYYKKVSQLKKNLITLLGILLSFLVIGSGLFYYNNSSKESNESNKIKLQKEISVLQEKSSYIEEKIAAAIRFKNIWNNADLKRKIFNEVKISAFSEKINSIIKKYNFTNLIMNVSPTEVLTKDIYSAIKTINVNLIKCIISFDSVSDIETIKFIEELKNSLTGYLEIKDVTIKKNKKEGYERKELVNISSGNGSGIVSNKITISWYFLTLKNQAVSPDK